MTATVTSSEWKRALDSTRSNECSSHIFCICSTKYVRETTNDEKMRLVYVSCNEYTTPCCAVLCDVHRCLSGIRESVGCANQYQWIFDANVNVPLYKKSRFHLESDLCLLYFIVHTHSIFRAEFLTLFYWPLNKLAGFGSLHFTEVAYVRCIEAKLWGGLFLLFLISLS